MRVEVTVAAVDEFVVIIIDQIDELKEEQHDSSMETQTIHSASL